MAEEGPEAPASSRRVGVEGGEGVPGAEAEAGKSEELSGPPSLSQAASSYPEVPPKQVSNGAPKPDEAELVKGCNERSVELTAPTPKPQVATEEVPQLPRPVVVPEEVPQLPRPVVVPEEVPQLPRPVVVPEEVPQLPRPVVVPEEIPQLPRPVVVPEEVPQLPRPVVVPEEVPQLPRPVVVPEEVPQLPRPVVVPEEVPQLPRPVVVPEEVPQLPRPVVVPEEVPQLPRPVVVPEEVPQLPRPVVVPEEVPQLPRPVVVPEEVPQLPRPVVVPEEVPQLPRPVVVPEEVPQLPRPVVVPEEVPQLPRPVVVPEEVPQLPRPVVVPEEVPQLPRPVVVPEEVPQLPRPVVDPEEVPQLPRPVVGLEEVPQLRRRVVVPEEVPQLPKPEVGPEEVPQLPRLVGVPKEVPQLPRLVGVPKEVRQLPKPDVVPEEIPQLLKLEVAPEEVPQLLRPQVAPEEVPQLPKPDIATEEVPQLLRPEVATEEVPQLPRPVAVPEEVPQLPRPVAVPEEVPQLPRAVAVPEEVPQLPRAVAVPEEVPQLPRAVAVPEEVPQLPRAVAVPEEVPQLPRAVVATEQVPQLPRPDVVKEEVVQLRAPDVVTHVAVIPSMEELSVPYPLEFERYWRAAQENPLDFTAWTDLLQYVEQENHIYAARKAFDTFFLRYPYCYGYWKKYADMERRFDFIKETEEVFQRGLQSIPLSMDLWIHYISFLQTTLDMNLPDSAQKICGTFESAIAAAGVDFRSDKLWEIYLDWEREQGDLKAMTAIYDRVLNTPTQLYSHHWEKFKEHVTSHPPRDILSTEELLWIQSKMTSETVTKAAETEAEEAPPGEDLPPKTETRQETRDGSQILGHLDQDKIREFVISIRQQIHAQNEAEVSKRWNFEEGIKRPYFHVKPLERAQLRNWRDYLDFEMGSGSHERTIVLFERCVIACALYEEFWIKYTRYLENHSISGARSVFQRACCYHLPRKPNIHLLWAAFEEKQGEVEEARRILKSFEDCVPGLVMVRLRRVSLERRQGNMEGAEALLMEAIRDNEGMPVSSFYSVKLARQVLKVQKNLIKARKILLEALEKDPDNAKLYANLLEMEFGADVRQNEGNTMSSFDRALTSGLPLETKIIFSQRRVEFLEDFGSSINSLLTSYDDHQKLLNQQIMRKRLLENGADEVDEKRVRLDDASAGGNLAVATTGITPLMAADVTNSATGAYNYNNWYQNYSGYGYQNTWNYNQYYQQS